MLPAEELQQPSDREHQHTTPDLDAARLIQMPVGYVVQTSQPSKGVGPGEKQALAGGFFVIFSLALALAVGWWMTPAPSSSAPLSETSTRDTRAAIAPGGEDGVEPEFDGRTANKEVVTNIERESVEEILVQPPASQSASTSPPNKQSAPYAATAEKPSSSSSEEKKNSNRAAEREEEQLQRLKAQAYAETRRDRLGNSPAAKAPSTSEPSTPQSSPSRDRAAQPKRIDLSAAVAECSNEAGIFFRERCKWRLCNGRWENTVVPAMTTTHTATGRQ